MNESREHILKTAFVLFLQKSYKEVTLKEIVEKSGLSKGAFYHYFPSKEKLFREIVETFYFTQMKIDFDSFRKDSFHGFYHDVIRNSVMKFMDLKEFLSDTNDEDDITYFTLVLDAVKLFSGFKEKSGQMHVNELSEWEKVIQSALNRGEITSKMTALQIAKLFIYSTDGMVAHLVLEGKIKEAQHEVLALYNGLYADLKV